MHLRQPAVAGRFYTDVPADLRAEVESFLKQGATLPASVLAAGDAAHLAGLMLPHAGHVYSGRVIGATLAHVRLPRTVFLLCPNHTGLGTPLSVWPAGAWQTPLGPVPVDGEMARLLCEADEDFSADVMGHMREHSIEVLLPFLQVCAGDAPLHVVPVCVGTGQAPVLRTAGQRLARVLERCRSRDGQRPLLLVSSDMNHYEDQRTTLRKDDLALDAALKGDADALLATGLRRVFISMGGDGIFAADHAGRVHVPCFKGEMVNTTGCGDASMAAAAWAYLEGTDLIGTARAALAAGAIAMESAETINPRMSAEALTARMGL